MAAIRSILPRRPVDFAAWGPWPSSPGRPSLAAKPFFPVPPNPALARADIAFRIRLAGVVDIARDVLADRTVDGPAVRELEQIFVLDRVVFFLLGIQKRPKIPDDFGALLDPLGGEEA